MDWLQSHATELLAIVGGVYALAAMVVKLTPSKKDDEVLRGIGEILDAIGVKGAEDEESKDCDRDSPDLT